MDSYTSLLMAILADVSSIETMLQAMANVEIDQQRKARLTAAVAMAQSIHGRVAHELIVLEDDDVPENQTATQ